MYKDVLPSTSQL